MKRNRYCSTFKINIESSFIHSTHMFICLQANKYWYPVLAAFQSNFFLKSGVFQNYIFDDKS